jgi:hypothetical protein
MAEREPTNWQWAFDGLQCGTLTIDWENRTFELDGDFGCDIDQMTPDEMLRALRQEPKPGTTVFAIATWSC